MSLIEVSLARVMTGSLTVTVALLTVVVVPLTVKLPVIPMLPPTFRLPPIPTPPVTLRAPVDVEDDSVALVMEMALVVVALVFVTL